jgi:hypothetical protein
MAAEPVGCRAKMKGYTLGIIVARSPSGDCYRMGSCCVPVGWSEIWMSADPLCHGAAPTPDCAEASRG